MAVRVGAVTALWLIAEGVATTHMRDVFTHRSEAEWKDVWHKERHAVCRQDLLKHMFWACEKDIYRLSRRSSQDYVPGTGLMRAEDALTMLRYRRLGRETSITRDCCWNSRGCTWEQYAEYCPANRRRHLRLGP